MKTVQWLLIGAASCALTFSACSDSPPVDPNDASDHPDTDDGEHEAIEPGSRRFAEACREDADCGSTLCIGLGGFGSDNGVCSIRCVDGSDESCDDDWECKVVSTQAVDDISACVPANLCVDVDGDGYGIGSGCLGPDCNDNDPTTHPGAPELCDGIDNNCNGRIDDFPVDASRPCETGLHGVCSIGTSACADGVLACHPHVIPGTQPEACDGLDNDCDGLIDEPASEPGEFAGIPGLGNACDPTGGTCKNGRTVCNHLQGGIQCEAGLDPGDDSLCNGIDDNCDGVVDSGVANLGQRCYGGHGVCQRVGVFVCDSDPASPAVCSALADDSAISEETCDYLDNDCNGIRDDGFVDENDKYFTVEHCGTCNNNCIEQLRPTPDSSHSTAVCDTSLPSPQCSYRCASGYADPDGRPLNGCELKINGDAIYVSPTNKGGTNSATCGTWDLPCATIAYGTQRAVASSKKILLVTEGIFEEGIVLPNGFTILGGHHAITWEHDSSKYRSFITGNALAASFVDVAAVFADAITAPTELRGFVLAPPQAPAAEGASIGVYARNATSSLVIADNEIRPNLGREGASGDSGSSGRNGRDGSRGADARPYPNGCGVNERALGGSAANSTCAQNSGADEVLTAGAGASALCASYADNRKGSNGGTAPTTDLAPNAGTQGIAGTTAASRYSQTTVCPTVPNGSSIASDGGHGGEGRDPSSATGGTNVLSASTTGGRLVGQAGQRGARGGSGGSGGGGGAGNGYVACTTPDANCTSHLTNLGGGGGSGGTGGCGGLGGFFGTAGGHSIAVFVSDTTTSGLTTLPSFTNNLITMGLGGRGGEGGNGGAGGIGGNGGNGGSADAISGSCQTSGRRGGNGGRGASGRGGGGGAGGASIGFAASGVRSTLRANVTALADANSFQGPTDDLGGAGGTGGNIAGPQSNARSQNGVKGQTAKTLVVAR